MVCEFGPDWYATRPTLDIVEESVRYLQYIHLGKSIMAAYLEQVDVHLRLAADHALRFFPTEHLQHLKQAPQVTRK